MDDDISTVDTEMIPPPDPFTPRQYRITFQCGQCGKKYKRTFKAIPMDDPPCPNKSCADKKRIAELERTVANLTKMFEEQRAPGHIGNNVRVHAIDKTAEVVMEDYKMTDLKDSIRPGEAMAPKLPAPAQAMADNYFSPKGQVPVIGSPQNKISSKQLNTLGRQALAGSFRSMAVGPSSIRPGSTKGDTGLRQTSVRSNDLYQKRS